MAVKRAQDQPVRKAASGELAEKVHTPSQRLRDMRAHGKEIRQSKESAAAFLERAGILNKDGKLTKPYRD